MTEKLVHFKKNDRAACFCFGDILSEFLGREITETPSVLTKDKTIVTCRKCLRVLASDDKSNIMKPKS